MLTHSQCPSTFPLTSFLPSQPITLQRPRPLPRTPLSGLLLAEAPVWSPGSQVDLAADPQMPASYPANNRGRLRRGGQDLLPPRSIFPFFTEVSSLDSASFHLHPELRTHLCPTFRLNCRIRLSFGRMPCQFPTGSKFLQNTSLEVSTVFSPGPVFREGCQFLHPLGVLRVTCYFIATALHFQCFKAFHQSGLIHNLTSTWMEYQSV